MAARKVFLDTNILVYAQDADSPAKQRRSRTVIAELAASGSGVISTQVLQEFFVTATQKLAVPPLSAKAVMKTFGMFEIVPISAGLIDEAIDCSILNALSFWDGLIVAAAAASGCGVLFSEDLNPGQVILGVRIENPLKE